MTQKKDETMVVGIAGGTGSGKTTLAGVLLESVGRDQIAYLPHDAYYRDQKELSLEERAKVNYDHPDSLETELMIEHINQLKEGQAVEMPVYDFTTHSRKKETVHVASKPVILVEGILVFVEEELRQLFDVKIYVDTDADIRFIRPMHLEFVEKSKRYADIIVPEGGLNVVALDMVIARLQSLLNGELPVESKRKKYPD